MGSCPPSTFNFIEAIHAKAARIVHHMPQDLNDSDSLKRVNWMPLSHIYNSRILTIMEECKEGLKDTRIRDLFKLKEHKYMGTIFAMIRHRKETARGFIRYKGPVLWSKLSQPIRDSNTSIDSFKKHQY